MSTEPGGARFMVFDVPGFAFVCYLIAFVIAFFVFRDIWARHMRKHR